MATNTDVSFSFAGCGFLGMYHIGVATCLREQIPDILEHARFAGASAGALTACGIICKINLSYCVDFTLQVARACGQLPLGGWEPDMDIAGLLRKMCDAILPDNAHELCTDRLFVSVTTLPWCQNRVISKFDSKEDLIDALVCSCFIPAFSSYSIPKYKGEPLMDGAFSDNLPKLDENTITVCPFAGEHSICPRDPLGQTFPLTFRNFNASPTTENALRFKDAFMSATPDKLKNYCLNGLDDAMRFLHEHDLIIYAEHQVSADLDPQVHRMNPENCTKCDAHRHLARDSRLPAHLLSCWDNDGDGSMLASSSHLTSVVTTPVTATVNIFLTIPVTMVKDSVLQLLSTAYFHTKEVGPIESSKRFLKNILNLKSFLSELMMEMITKALFSGMELSVRVCSEVILAKDVVFKGVCKQSTSITRLRDQHLQPRTPAVKHERKK